MKHRASNLWRSLVISGVIALTLTGVSYAALQSLAGIVKGNSIQTAVASLQVSPNNSTFSSSMDGYAFGNLIPGGTPSPNSGYPVFLKNVGTTPLAVRLSIGPQLTNGDNLDLSKAHLILTPSSGGAPQSFTLQDLVSASTSGGLAVNNANHLLPNQSMGFTMQISLDSDAVSGPSASLSNVDFNFGALAVN